MFPLSRETSSLLGITSPRPNQKPLPPLFDLFTMTTPEVHVHSPERGRSPRSPSPGIHRRTPGNTPPPPPQGIEEQFYAPPPPLPQRSPPPRRSPPPPGPPSRRSSRSSTRSRHKSKQRERGRKPDAFTNKSQYRLFRQQIYLYLGQNPDIYRDNIEKVQFALGFFTEGLPAEWAFLFIEKVARKDREKHPVPWGTWDEFTSELEVVFGDPNEE